MFKGLDKEMKDFLMFKGVRNLTLKEKLRAILIYPYVLTIYTYALLQHKLNNK